MFKNISQFLPENITQKDNCGEKSPKKSYRNPHSPKTKTQHVQSSLSFISLIESWEQVMGKMVAKYCVPVRLQRGQLIIAVEHPVFAQELNLMQHELIKKIQATHPQLKQVSQLKFIHNPDLVISMRNNSGHNSDSAGNNHKPQPHPKLHPLSPEYRSLKLQIEKEFGDFDDKESLELLISLYHQNQKTP